jgi:hypothetical protein
MAKVGRFIIDPKAGSYCQIDLDDGKKILVNHETGGPQGGRLTVTEKKLWGGETFLDLKLTSPEGKAALARLTQGAPEGTARATPLGAVVEALKDAASVADVRSRCRALAAGAA